MERIVVAFADEDNCRKITRLLRAKGYTAAHSCTAGTEAIRAVREMGGGLVICGFRLRDMAAEELADSLLGLAVLLVIARAANLELCRCKNMYKLPTPVPRADFYESIEYLMETNHLHATWRNEDETELIRKAKAYLMEKGSLSEAEAHRLLQKRSMDAGAKLADTARAILKMRIKNETPRG